MQTIVKKRKEKYSSFMLESGLFRVESLANKVAYNKIKKIALYNIYYKP